MKRKLGSTRTLTCCHPEEIPQFMKDNEIFWVDDARKFMAAELEASGDGLELLP